MELRDSSSLSRRDALKLIGATAAIAGIGVNRVVASTAPDSALGWELPALGFGYDALEPHIDARTMEIHLTKHHQAYITNARKLLEGHADLLARGPAALVGDLGSVPEAIRPGIRNNAGGHVNHAFFWKLLSPTRTAPGPIGQAIERSFGSLDEFKKQFTDVATKRFGSGWAWLSAKRDGSLFVHSTANQDSPLSEGLTPLIGLDVWEHAYYLRYQNRRADYVAAFWNVLNWTQADANYAAVGQA